MRCTLQLTGRNIALQEFLEGKQSESSEVELQWRYARALYDVADKTGGHTTAQKKALVEKAMGVIERALVAGGENFAVHKWHGIVLNKVGEYQGTKATIQNSFVVREHWQVS